MKLSPSTQSGSTSRHLNVTYILSAPWRGYRHTEAAVPRHVLDPRVGFAGESRNSLANRCVQISREG